MFEIEKIFTFEAGHILPLHDGMCKNPHGHSYILKVRLRAKELITTGPQTNMVKDFSDISNIVKPMITQYFDHKWLNDTLDCPSPTVEYIAKWIYDHLKPKLPQLHAISLHETGTSIATYTQE